MPCRTVIQKHGHNDDEYVHTSQQLPVEIIQEIVAFCAIEKEAACRLCLVCRTFFEWTVQHLYHTVSLTGLRCKVFYSALASPFRGRFYRSAVKNLWIQTPQLSQTTHNLTHVERLAISTFRDKAAIQSACISPSFTHLTAFDGPSDAIGTYFPRRIPMKLAGVTHLVVSIQELPFLANITPEAFPDLTHVVVCIAVDCGDQDRSVIAAFFENLRRWRKLRVVGLRPFFWDGRSGRFMGARVDIETIMDFLGFGGGVVIDGKMVVLQDVEVGQREWEGWGRGEETVWEMAESLVSIL